MGTEKKFFSVREASQDFFNGQISAWTIRSWLRTGRLAGQKAGSRVLIMREDLEAFVKPRPVTSAAAREVQ